MDQLGFDKFWNYEKQDEIPILWAESTSYWYKGQLIAKIKGGDLYSAPELRPTRDEDGNVLFSKEDDGFLLPIDLEGMIAANEELLSVIEDSTVKKIVKEYEKFNKKLDIFHVAFSGGKDSAVLLDLVKKALPKDSFVVVFGDTGMEFSDTYETVFETEKIRRIFYGLLHRNGLVHCDGRQGDVTGNTNRWIVVSVGRRYCLYRRCDTLRCG